MIDVKTTELPMQMEGFGGTTTTTGSGFTITVTVAEPSHPLPSKPVTV